MTHQGASDDMYSPGPSGAAVAGPPPAPVAAATAAAGGVLTLGSIATVAGAILIFVVISIGLVSLLYVFDAWERDGAQVSRRRGGGGGVRARGGVDPGVLRSLPVMAYRAAPGSENEECAVCLAELEDGDEARFLPRCGHGFHAGCVDTWLASHTTCPLCRLTVAAKPDAASPAPALGLRPVPPEPANYAATLPASVLLGVSDRGAVSAVTMASDGDTRVSAGATAVLVIEIPELAVPTLTPRNASKSPGSARPRSFRRLWSFGRQGAGPSSSSCSCAGAGAGEGADVEQGNSVSIGIAVAETPPSSGAAAAGATQGSAV